MYRPLVLLAAAAVAAHALSGCAARPGPALPPPVTSERDTIRAFSGEAELAQFLVQLSQESKREYDRVHADDPHPGPIIDHFYHIPPPLPRPAGVPVQVSTPAVSGSGSIEPSPPVSPPAPVPGLTPPVQIRGGAPATGAGAVDSGMDEGGIVKAVGDHLVVLHRGRLFTVRIGGGALQPVSAVDAFGPGVRATSHTFDRLLVSGDQVMVLGTDGFGSDDYVWVGVFHLAPDGRLVHRATYGLRSVDSYRRSLYASRTDAVQLVGNRLVFYVPLPADSRNPLAGFPAVRGPGVVSSPAAAVRVYRPAGRASGLNLHLHVLTTCDLADGPPRCESTALLADGDRPFHVTPTAVYLWATQREHDET
ncbi:MAG TPA: hypothetical protein VFX98_18455, partial [Longimicrobiaceae bacterium]|nr:hypothetical protein [Longimicrobiaceae bacterium]